jgi:hypothetical protein
MADEKDTTSTAAKFGALGGKKRAANLSPEEMKEIAKKGAAARWGLPRASHEGELNIPGVVPLKVANLKDGRRVLMSRAFLEALGRPWKGTYKHTARPNFIDAKNLDPFIKGEILNFLEPIEYLSISGQKRTGYRAELLPLVCKVYIAARDAGALNPGQKSAAKFADVLLNGFEQIGIISLVDDATGYTKVRARDELQAILAAYISAELLPWAKRFPDSFYEELHRVWGWNYTHGSNARNAYIGKLTKALIYDPLPPGVIEELESRNPYDPEKRRRKHLHHQLLTSGVGHPHLEKQIVSVTTLLRISSDKDEFIRHFAKAFPPACDDLFAPPPKEIEGSTA